MGMTVSFVSHRTEAVASIKEAASQRMLAAVITVRNETREVLSGQRHGKVYKLPTTVKSKFEGELSSAFVLSGGTQQKKGTGKRYTASAPGEAPADRTSNLKGKVKYSVRGEGQTLIGDVGTNVKYAAPLEYGYPPRNLAARPWLRKSFENATDAILGIWRRPWL